MAKNDCIDLESSFEIGFCLGKRICLISERMNSILLHGVRGQVGQAVAYACDINNDPAKRELNARKVKKRQIVYHYTIKEYLQNNSE
jgi:hypothetical protein